jgi:phosphoribosylformimino-5-aminoimidazole carboxamide ribotide isomerase
MQIIPVIDLKEGVAVHARCGRRDEYRPLNSPLCPSSDPFDVVRAYLSLGGIKTIYVADLDAITAKTPQIDLLRALKQAFADIEFWLDGGWPIPDVAMGIPVVGSESLDQEAWRELKQRSEPWILSLDFRDGKRVGPQAIIEDTGHWPVRVIHMNLNRVGSGMGPDVSGLADLLSMIPAENIVAAGGIRSVADLAVLSGMGIGQVLVASALHSGELSQVERNRS